MSEEELIEQLGKMSDDELEWFVEYCKLARELDAVVEGR